MPNYYYDKNQLDNFPKGLPPFFFVEYKIISSFIFIFQLVFSVNLLSKIDKKFCLDIKIIFAWINFKQKK